MSAPRVVDTLEALDEALDRAAAVRAQSDDAYRKTLSEVLLQPNRMLGKMPRDPASDEYRIAQLAFYERLTQRSYDVGREETPFDRAHMLRWPFPYATRSAATVGTYLMAYGQIIREMNLPPGAHVLEMGSGYGPLTHQLASMGYRVTCADISERLLEYVRTRCAGLPGAVDTICCDMNEFAIAGAYDAVVFFESFHHVLNHADLLRRIGGCLVDDGILVFAGEPIVPNDSEIVPYPWGLRMDGMSLWAIRRQGWLELGFRVDYFSDLLRRTGWSHRRAPSISFPGTDIWICRRARAAIEADGKMSQTVHAWRAADDAILTQCGDRSADGTLRSRGEAGYLAYGPYQPLDAGTYEVVWEGTNDGASSAAVAEVACRIGQDVLRETAMTPGSGILARARFHLREAVADAEFRVRVGAGDVVALRGIELRRIT
ncbi:MAG TPA: class I SAM-dependent methyltransferase [Rhodanobacteraceae bacterium]|nr:class I SAM-dependent methyltransferase [Rhodanobacteraceae bacterium]